MPEEFHGQENDGMIGDQFVDYPKLVGKSLGMHK